MPHYATHMYMYTHTHTHTQTSPSALHWMLRHSECDNRLHHQHSPCVPFFLPGQLTLPLSPSSLLLVDLDPHDLFCLPPLHLLWQINRTLPDLCGL